GGEMRKILIVYSHPRENSLNHAIKEALLKGLKRSRAEVRAHDLYETGFNPILYDETQKKNDPEILRKQNDILWAEGIIFVSPVWWASVSAMLKGYFDRVFTEGFAFEYNPAGIPVGLLENKKALLIGTCDTLAFLIKFSGAALGFKSVIKGILKFNGIKNSRFLLFGSVLRSNEEKRKEWIIKTEKIAEQFAKPQTMAETRKKKLYSMIKAARLHFYSFVFCSFFLGTAIGASVVNKFSWFGFGIAALIGLLGHIAVSFSNEVTDVSTDEVNHNRTIFNGGTGVLLKGLVRKADLSLGWIISSILVVFLCSLLVLLNRAHWFLIVCSTVPLFLGLEYSFPPFKFSRSGLGEIAAFIAYGLPLMFIGFLLQTEAALFKNIVSEFRFYLLSLPISISVFMTLCLTQIPDTDADRSAGKKSISVLMGSRNVLILSGILSFLCAALVLCLFFLGVFPLKYLFFTGLLPFITGFLILANLDAAKVPAGMTMLNLMGLSVTSAVLSGIVPAIYFLSNPVRINLLK
ncbi:NAD(P)H-dependent oxidoreductase, partial [Acidobacteriota bacterium]